MAIIELINMAAAFIQKQDGVRVAFIETATRTVVVETVPLPDGTPVDTLEDITDPGEYLLIVSVGSTIIGNPNAAAQFEVTVNDNPEFSWSLNIGSTSSFEHPFTAPFIVPPATSFKIVAEADGANVVGNVWVTGLRANII